MNKIPTAKNFLSKTDEFETLETNKQDEVCVKAMIEFAKLHVEAAIKICIEEAPSGSSTDTVSYKDVVEALTDCYPLTNIK